MTATIVSPPTPSQWASASLHLERRANWRTVRIDGTRYVVLPSGRSAHVYQVRADGAGCSCSWYQRTGQRCSHMLALDLAALEIELSDAAIDATLGPAPAPSARSRYEALFPACRDCGDLADGLDNRCSRCASDREHEQRMTARREHVANA